MGGWVAGWLGGWVAGWGMRTDDQQKQTCPYLTVISVRWTQVPPAYKIAMCLHRDVVHIFSSHTHNNKYSIAYISRS